METSTPGERETMVDWVCMYIYTCTITCGLCMCVHVMDSRCIHTNVCVCEGGGGSRGGKYWLGFFKGKEVNDL